MDWVTLKNIIREYGKKYRYVVIVLAAGLLLMTIPEGPKQEKSVQVLPNEVIPDLEESLCQILSKVSGAGRVEVLLSEAVGEETVFQVNENRSQSTEAADIRTDTVLVTDEQRRENGLIKKIIPPSYMGAIVLCEGADNAAVRLSIMEAVRSVTGLSSDRITVLKMK